MCGLQYWFDQDEPERECSRRPRGDNGRFKPYKSVDVPGNATPDGKKNPKQVEADGPEEIALEEEVQDHSGGLADNGLLDLQVDPDLEEYEQERGPEVDGGEAGGRGLEDQLLKDTGASERTTLDEGDNPEENSAGRSFCRSRTPVNTKGGKRLSFADEVGGNLQSASSPPDIVHPEKFPSYHQWRFSCSNLSRQEEEDVKEVGKKQE